MRPILIFGYGNPSRGDDAIGPLLIEQLARLDLPDVDLLTDFQLQVEHALDLRGRERVLFVDASYVCQDPYELTRIQPAADASYTSHAMSPAAVLQACAELYGEEPESWMLAVRGVSFELGEPLSVEATGSLDAAVTKVLVWLDGDCAQNEVK
ncbi:MAG: hydrogenase maturation protease [Sulfuricellaceae bacterium]|nr:hydrogenase maturation protease [Sulfuricellaceae bacterium]